MPPRFSPERVVVGAGLVALGALGFLSRLGRLEFLNAVHVWWPAILVLWGVVELYNTYSARSAGRVS
jgi:cell wall-active antibiotic response 4TMS protein YvqF